MKVATSWSGGKDSCLACFRAMNTGHEVTHLLNFYSRESGKVSAHGVSSNLVRRQAQAIGIPLVQFSVPEGANAYERRLKHVVSTLKTKGLEGMVFGDIYLQEHRDWIERVCGDMGISPVFPLWKVETRELLHEFAAAGFESVVVSVKASVFGPELLGTRVNRESLEGLTSLCQQHGSDVCGEGGEYHTLVVDGPIFRSRLDLIQGERRQRDGHWFLDITRSYIVLKD